MPPGLRGDGGQQLGILRPWGLELRVAAALIGVIHWYTAWHLPSDQPRVAGSRTSSARRARTVTPLEGTRRVPAVPNREVRHARRRRDLRRPVWFAIFVGSLSLSGAHVRSPTSPSAT